MKNYHMYLDGFYQLSVEATSEEKAILKYRRVYSQMYATQRELKSSRIEAREGV